MEIRVLGPLGAFDDGRPVSLGGPRQRSVLAGLVARADETVTTDWLIDVVWGEDPPPTARKSLQVYVSRLRRIIGESVIEGSSQGYRLRSDSVLIDALRFEDLVEQGRELLSINQPAALDALETGLALWRGVPLSDIDRGFHLVPYVERLRETRLAAIEDRTDAALALGRHRDLVGDLQSLTDAHPLRERMWGQLMLALYRSGRQAEALRAYQRCRLTLSQELGIEPSSALQQLEERVLAHDPSLDLEESGDRAPSGPVRNPYKGLRSFTEADAGDFFGREQLIVELAARVGTGARVLSLIGPSGSGKSSVVMAGLIPAIRGPARTVTSMIPGTQPFAHLEAALTRAAPGNLPVVLDTRDHLSLLRSALTLLEEGSELVIVIDQFEELLTGAMADEIVTSFVRNLTEAVEDPQGRVTLVLTLRSDFLDLALRHPAMSRLLSTGVVGVPSLSPVEMMAAVVAPAEAVGLRIDPELVTELIAETGQHPGSLPLLQFVLTELADQAEGRTLTAADLTRVGGIRATLAKRSEEIYQSLSDMGKEAARAIFLHLVTLNEDGEPTRRVAVVEDLDLPGVSAEHRHAVLDAFVAGRLVTSGRDAVSGRSTVEVAHEAVLREWPRCRRWFEEARTDIRLAAELERAAADWDLAGKSPDYLIKGSRLLLTEEWAAATAMGLTPRASDFLAAAVERRDDDQRAEATRSEQERALERRAMTRLRAAVGVLALLVVVTTGLSVFAAGRSREADVQRQAALSATTEILVRQLSYASFAEAGRDPELGLLLALHAVRAAEVANEPITHETVEALHWGIQALGVEYPVVDGEVFPLVGADGIRGAFHLPIDQLVSLARSHVGRQLTPEECRNNFSSAQCPVLPHEMGTGLSAGPIRTGGMEMLIGSTVRVASGYEDEEAVAFNAELAAFTAETGILATHSGATSPDAVFSGEIPFRPDIVIGPQPGRIEGLADRLVDVGQYLEVGKLTSDYGPYLTRVGTVGSETYAIPLGVSVKSLIWYPQKSFERAGYRIPTTWDELIDLSDQIVASGGTPWCFAEESGQASGWPATDWVEDLLLHEHGPQVYDAWANGEIPFSDPRVRRAFERLGDIFFSDGFVYGGAARAISTNFASGGNPLLEDPPGCWLHHQASFFAGFLPGPGVYPFVTPSITDEYSDSMVMGGDFALVLSDRPEVRELVRHLASPEFGHSMLLHLPGFIASNRRFPVDAYPEVWRRDLAVDVGEAQAADLLRFDGSDLMPPWIGTVPFWRSMIEYLEGGPETLDLVLARLDALADSGP